MLAVLAVGLAPAAAEARASQQLDMDGYTARCNTVNTETLPRASLERYDVEQSADRGLLTCLVQRRGGDPDPPNMPARVEAEYHRIGRPPQAIDIRETESDDLVTYIGTYPVESRYPISFEVTIAVEGVAPVTLYLEDQQPRE